LLHARRALRPWQSIRTKAGYAQALMLWVFVRAPEFQRQSEVHFASAEAGASQ